MRALLDGGSALWPHLDMAMLCSDGRERETEESHIPTMVLARDGEFLLGQQMRAVRGEGSESTKEPASAESAVR